MNSPRKHGRLVRQRRPSDSAAPVITAVDHILSYAFADAYTPAHEESLAMGMPPGVLEQRSLKKGRGCLHCRQTGYSGRDGIFELQPVTDEIRRLISEQADSARLFDAGRPAGMRTLREAAIEKVLNGTTTVSEMVRVTGK